MQFSKQHFLTFIIQRNYFSEDLWLIAVVVELIAVVVELIAEVARL